jgi:chitinase
MVQIVSLLQVLPIFMWPAGHVAPLTEPRATKVVIGYVQDERDSASAVDDVDFSKITHLNIAFANPTDANGTILPTPHLGQFVERAHRSKVKVLISIGGGFASEDKTLRERYFDLISDSKRSGFVKTLSSYVDENRLDGLDVDLEGPAIGKDYAAFVLELSNALKPKHKLLTAAVSGWSGSEPMPMSAVNCFDFVNVMAYDATGPWNRDRPGQHSSMDFAKQAAAMWIAKGVAKEKIVLGVPFYGWGFGAAFTEGGYQFSDIVTKFPGSELLDQAGDTVWYNGIPTIKAKVQYVVDQGLGGIMIWSLNQDAKGKLSLLKAIHDVLSSQ